MNTRAIWFELWKARVREGRVAILLGGMILLPVIALVAFATSRPESLSPLGSERMGQEVICRTYGEGGRVCFPAPEKLIELREDRRERLEREAR